VGNKASGTYNHHMVVSFETEITKLIDFDIAWIWDRIENPREDANGITPASDDFRTTVGLTFEFQAVAPFSLRAVLPVCRSRARP
jgi:hypothetical protein